MKKVASILILTLMFSCVGNAQDTSKEKNTYKVVKTASEWKELLSPIAYNVLREAGTEKPYTHEFKEITGNGIFVCAACKTELYKAEHKFDSGTGWPSFDRAVKGNVELDVDYKIGYARTELKCNTCGGHLGHSFDDGPKTTGKRHCINGAALEFIAEK
ncbi:MULTISPECIES: peptide-methionine (R)-S-oxide reductase MsrB [unclassified Polaribacter]|uniref:peptide-methionine (R)-S-oxide reductase MsrB n=1 Tax=unclassified Polaribacter TaxID=196858 RepID=UPI0011BE4621|nr:MULTISPECIES: peptide-methionine (R)-S-oxide reductase MsrB [unclassified Polaribacter]TXD51695.1 peptide-methionine (R)-S-oxide reductase MsrB [Polaribacter sp. IC063]TXD59554.1 peptide-methionine (R)-S-oxide reductase MsrB [Polaribacter sp. IC066]